MNICVTIREDGSLVCLDNAFTAAFNELGPSVTKRASHVEPDTPLFRLAFHLLRRFFGDKGRMSEFTRNWPCLWRVNTSPVGGPILPGRWKNRQEAIAAEVEWLNEHLN